MRTTTRSTAMLLLAVLALASVAATSSAQRHREVQTVPVMWHAQSGNEGAVGDDATATLIRTRDRVRYRFATEHLRAGHAYTVWFVVVNDPASCAAAPCSAADILGDPATDGQVTFGRSGAVAGRSGARVFGARFRAGPLLDGWLQVQGLDDPLGAEIHLVLNDHGPVIPELRHEMVTTYRAGCTDESLPPPFPPAAIADGTPGPNTCQLYQAAIFPSPAA